MPSLVGERSGRFPGVADQESESRLSDVELKEASFLIAFLTLFVRYLIGMLVVVAPGLRILPELFGICRWNVLNCFRTRRA